MRTKLEITDLPYLNRFIAGTDLKILTDLMLCGERIEQGSKVVFKANAEDIAQRTDLCTATVYKGLKRLLDADYLTVDTNWRKGKEGEGRSYVVNI